MLRFSMLQARQSASIASNKHLVKLMIDRGTDTESSCSQDDRSARDQGNTTTRDPDVSDMAVVSECQVVADEPMDCDVDVQLLEVKKGTKVQLHLVQSYMYYV